MDLLCRLKNLVHKGILKEEDLDRIVIIPKDQQPCDCISRAEALKNLALTNSKDDVYRMINSLSSVQPKPKTGHWIDDKCSVCGKGIEDLISSNEWYRNEKPNFCSFCGVKLFGSESEGDK